MKKILIFFLFSLITASASADDLDFLFKSNRDYQNVFVKEVRGIDLIVIETIERKNEIVRLIGVKAPEIKKRDRPVIERDEFGFRVEPEVSPESPIEERGFLFVLDLLDQKRVRLEFDDDKKDDELNTLAYVFLKDENTFINAEILRQGYAQLQVRPPNTKYKQELRSAYKEAREQFRGVHGQ